MPPDQVQVWRIAFDLPEGVVRQLRATLSADEHRRADRFFFERDRRHFIVCRGALRVLLGRYLGVAPAEIALRAGSKGKPHLAGGYGQQPLRFNVSHSGGVALIAFTIGREVGVDVEQKRAISDLDALVEISFSPAERAALLALPEGLRHDAFFACWTRKEAFIKAIGEGLSFPLAAFDVAIAPGEPAKLLRVGDDPGEASRWEMSELPLESGYRAALVVEGHGFQVRTLGFNEWFTPELQQEAA